MQLVIKYLFKTVIQGIAISFVIAFVLIGIEMIFGKELVFDAVFAKTIGYYCLYGVTLTLINSSYFDYLNYRVNWAGYRRHRFIIGATGSIFLTMIGVFFIRMLINVGFENQSIGSFVQNEKLQYYVVSLIITMVISLFFHAFYFYKKSQENKVKEQKIIAGTASAKFESLKNQIDPHFLFNSLNVLSSLIEENTESAQRFTTSLSKVYRYVLEQKDKELVSVDEELAFAKTYMNLLKMRFENSLFYELPESVPNPDAKVVPLSLQLLLENTVKHNIASEQKPLHIRIFIENDMLVIQNDFQKKEVLQDRQGVGLQNIVSRYNVITRRKVLVEQSEKTFTVKIPILTKQVAVMEPQDSYSENTAYHRAKKRLDELKGFYGNLIAYCCIIPFLVFINLAYSPEFQWFWFSAGGWGFGLLMHAFKVFGYSSKWEERKIKEILSKENTNQKWK